MTFLGPKIFRYKCSDILIFDVAFVRTFSFIRYLNVRNSFRSQLFLGWGLEIWPNSHASPTQISEVYNSCSTYSFLFNCGLLPFLTTEYDPCSNKNGGCQHKCHTTAGQVVCRCHEGFKLHPNGRDCLRKLT